MTEINSNGLPLLIGDSATWSRNIPRIAPPIREKSVKPAGRPTTRETPLIAPKSAAEGHTHIYVVRSLHLVKIGMAENLYIRLSNIRVDNPHAPEMVRFWEMAREVAKRVDVLARDLLHEFRHCGDWFTVPPERAIEAVEQMVDLVLRR